MKYITPVILSLLLICGVFILFQQYKSIPSRIVPVTRYFETLSPEYRIAVIPFDVSPEPYARVLSQSVTTTSDKNYDMYRAELLYAFHMRDIPLLNRVLSKYKIDYLVLDKRTNTYAPIKSLLANDNDAEIVLKDMHADIYHISTYVPGDTLLSLTTHIPAVGIHNSALERDLAYEEHGLYRSTIGDEAYDKLYPYVGLTGIVSSTGWNLHDEADHFFIMSDFQVDSDQYISNKSITHDVISFDTGEQIESSVEIAKLQIVNRQIVLYFPKQELTKLHADNAQTVNCNAPSKTCYSFTINQAHDDYGYLIAINSAKDDKTPYYEALKINNTIIDEGLNKSTPSHMIIPSISNSGKQYRVEVEKTAHFDNLVVYLFPYNELDSVRFVHKDKDIEHARIIANTTSEKVAPGLWSISMMQALGDKPSTAVFYMPYSSDYEAYQVTDSWKLLPWIGKKLTKHMEVNGWANAWIIDDPTAVYDHGENLIVVVNKAEYTKNMLKISMLSGVIIGVVILLILLYRTNRS